MPFTTQAANKMLDALGNTSFALPTTLYLVLFTTQPAEDGTGGTEVGASGYTRKPVSWSSATSRQKVNSAQITVEAAAAALYGTVTGFGLSDSATIGAGTLWWEDAVNPQLVVAAGSPVIVPAGQLVLQLP